MNEDEYKNDLESGKKTYFRGGSLLKKILTKPYKILSGQDCLDLFNTYGLPPKYLKILTLSHGYEMNDEEFIHLLQKQKEKMKCSQKAI